MRRNAKASKEDPVKMIYVLGSGHSGTTLLCLLLGAYQKVFPAGHLHNLHKVYGVEARCGCGVAARDCAFWNRVKADLDMQGITEFSPDDSFDARKVEAFYRSVLSASGKDILCNSSLNGGYLEFLLQAGFTDSFIVHIVRDGRAVYYSYLRKYTKMLLFPLQWARANLTLAKEYGERPNYILVRYEDLVTRPHEEVARIIRASAEWFKEDDLLPDDVQQIRFSFDNHIFNSNRMRFQKKVNIRKDTEYLSKIPSYKWLLWTLLALPGLRKFSYPMGAKSKTQG